MIIGVPKEIKNHEYRVGMTPASVYELCQHGHQLLVETQAGVGIGFSDQDYQEAGASIISSAAEVFAQADMIVKVKEPQAVERAMLRADQILFTYLHLAPDLPQTEDLIKSGAVCIAYETVTSARGGLPLLAPMSEVAGRMSIQAGAMALEKSKQGRGVLLGGVPGVEPAKVVILGGGMVGRNAAQMAVGMGANVSVLDRNVDVLRQLDADFRGQLQTIYSSSASVEEQISEADLVIGGVLLPGAAAPKLIKREMLGKMKPGAVIVDVAIDQGGCAETSKATTHQDPIYIVDGIVHYCVANMPGGVARTATMALNNATLPYIVTLANKGYRQALLDDEHLRNGLNVMHGKLCCEEVAQALQLDYVASEALLN